MSLTYLCLPINLTGFLEHLTLAEQGRLVWSLVDEPTVFLPLFCGTSATYTITVKCRSQYYNIQCLKIVVYIGQMSIMSFYMQCSVQKYYLYNYTDCHKLSNIIYYIKMNILVLVGFVSKYYFSCLVSSLECGQRMQIII